MASSFVKIAACAAAAASILAFAQPADAHGWGGHGGGGGFHGGGGGWHGGGGGWHGGGGGWHGGWGGGGWGYGLYGGWGAPNYAYPAYDYYDDDCVLRRQRVRTPYGWRVRTVRVCY